MKQLFLSCLLLGVVAISMAQKKPLDHSVYDGWQHIGERMISNDGKWVVYTIDPQEGDNELVIQSADTKYKKTIPRGYTALITEDSRYVVFKIKPFYKDSREAKIKKKKAEDTPKDSFAVVELGKEEIWKTEKVKIYKTPAKAAGWVAYHLDKPVDQPGKPKTATPATGKKVTDSLTAIIDSLKGIIQQIPERKRKVRDDGMDDEETSFTDAEGDEPGAMPAEVGTDMVLRKLDTGEEIVFYKTLEFYFSKTGDQLVVEKAKDPLDSMSKHSVLVYDLKAGKTTMLSNGGNDFKNFALTDDGTQIAYLAEREARPKDLQKFYKLWYYKNGMDSAIMLADKNTVDMKLGMTISEYGNLSFSKNGKRLFFGTAPIQPPKDTSIIEMDKPKLDIWHYNDDYLQTVQTLPARLRAAQQENFLTVYDLDKKLITQLGSKQIPQVLPTNEGDGDVFVGVTDVGKRIQGQWQGNTYKDIYAIDVNSGAKKLVKENLYGQVYPSSTGKYIMWYDRKAKHYFVWDGASTRNISAGIKFPLYNEEHDLPDEPLNYGVMGWHEGDSAVYVYDRYDVWKLHPEVKTINENITKTGRSFRDAYRYLRLDSDERFFKYNQVLYFRFQHQDTKNAGLRVGNLVDDQPLLFTVIDGEYAIGTVLKANKSRNIIYTKESYKESPDIYLNDDVLITQGSHASLKRIDHEVRLSSINPQQKDYNWGTSELFNWKAYDGKLATGIVYKPEDFDPKKKYPMIVYFYEKLSDDLHDYKEPAPIRSAVNVPFFVSRGYIIFMPDIRYRTGYPGQGAYDYIVSGTRALVKQGFVDSTNMALQGHSWGGYQAAQLATMTKLYKAIWAGAPVANMTSAYGGIRWESGVNRQFQYEKTQSRIGATLWEKPELYLKNSPLFQLNKVTAPMVIMHNDADGAVPWYQGIELFTGLRRLGKKVWMFNYNGQGHGLTQRQDMRDYQIRMQQFFDWILKGEKPAKWIVEGLPAVKKGKEWGLEMVQ
jgi:dienelactone hydrolase